MFGISFSELILILIIALVILGPKQLASVIGKFWLTIVSLRTQLEKIKSDLYTQSGMHEIKGFKNTLTDTYQNLKNKITNTPEPLPGYHTLFEEEILYQPELNFTREPELFDEFI